MVAISCSRSNFNITIPISPTFNTSKILHEFQTRAPTASPCQCHNCPLIRGTRHCLLLGLLPQLHLPHPLCFPPLQPPWLLPDTHLWDSSPLHLTFRILGNLAHAGSPFSHIPVCSFCKKFSKKVFKSSGPMDICDSFFSDSGHVVLSNFGLNDTFWTGLLIQLCS